MTFILWTVTALIVFFVIGLCREFAKTPGSERLLRWTLGIGAAVIGGMWWGAFFYFGERSDSEVVVDQSYLSSYPKEQYPKTYEVWGNAGVERIKAVERVALIKAAKQRKCDKVEYVSLSERLSQPPFGIVVFVDCKNQWRYYIDQDNEILSIEKIK